MAFRVQNSGGSLTNLNELFGSDQCATYATGGLQVLVQAEQLLGVAVAWAHNFG